ncbi:NADP-dependent malic enzyme, mitochondrial isoform X1 [Balaenoptera acutorostrata]|uniref:Malic enzyme n=2 Tax=Balaenoptera acutorostrata TaxID=9767 RepID=A0A383Z098_BALAC|nr:NADP-dependent malic enzyme, mitochondrial isoform X1 [Balaenoptera acutorostrata]
MRFESFQRFEVMPEFLPASPSLSGASKGRKPAIRWQDRQCFASSAAAPSAVHGARSRAGTWQLPVTGWVGSPPASALYPGTSGWSHLHTQWARGPQKGQRRYRLRLFDRISLHDEKDGLLWFHHFQSSPSPQERTFPGLRIQARPLPQESYQLHLHRLPILQLLCAKAWSTVIGQPGAHVPSLTNPPESRAVGERRLPKRRKMELTRKEGMAFTLEERLQLGIHGLIPPCFLSQDVQLLRIMRYYERQQSDLDKYIILMTLQDRNEKLFYRVLTSDVEKFMPIVYTPTVGLACQHYGLTFRRPRGLFITIHDKGHLATMLNSWPEDNIKAVVVTDGERILGLGDLGCYGMGIPVGKLALYTACGGVNPQQCLPVLLDVGTNNEELLRDPLYIGLKHRRVRGQEYDDLLDEFMQAVTDKFGINCLIQFEDFANANAFRLLNKYRNKYCMFNDDIQGTASIAVAGILAALRITKNKLSNHVFVFQGAGEAAMGIAHLLVMALEKEGVPKAEATRKIWMVDSKGLIVKGRSHLNHEKEMFAQDHPEVNSLEEVVRLVKPTAIIGVAAIAGAFTEQILRDMASFHERPIIFALSNPTSKAECTAEKCYQVTEGRGIFASGSPFKGVTLEDGRTFIPGQGNNAYVFPGVALGVIAGGVRHIPDGLFLLTAEQIAQEVSEQHLSQGRLYPPLSTIRDVSLRIAIKVLDFAYKHNLASYYPEPKDKEAFVRSLVYTPDYDSFTLDSYTWPKEAMNVQNV